MKMSNERTIEGFPIRVWAKQLGTLPAEEREREVRDLETRVLGDICARLYYELFKEKDKRPTVNISSTVNPKLHAYVAGRITYKQMLKDITSFFLRKENENE